MKSLESQLRAKIEKECSEIYTPDDLRGSHFVDGAHFLLPLVLKLYEGLVKAELGYRYKSHKHWQMVKQLDGTVQNELIETHDGKLHKELTTTLAEIDKMMGDG